MMGLAILITVAVLSGLLMHRLRQPALVGYILAGIVLGPSGFELLKQSQNINLLAELGVIMLLFIIGMELSLRGFMRVIKPSSIIAFGQIVVSLCFSMTVGFIFDWSVSKSLLMGFILALSSTAVSFSILEDLGELRSGVGPITVGTMIAQDIAVVPIIIIAQSMSGDSVSLLTTGLVIKLLISVILLVIFLRFLGGGRKLILPFTSSLNGDTSLLTLSMLAFATTSAAISGLIGLSLAYGAFLAGLVISASTIRAEAIRAAKPIQSFLIFVFFLSVGLLIDLDYISANWERIMLFTVGGLLLKSVINTLLIRFVGESWDHAVTGGLIMAQMGEFSFILAAIGISTQVFDAEGHQLAISVIALSLLLSPLWVTSIRNIHRVRLARASSIKQVLIYVIPQFWRKRIIKNKRQSNLRDRL
jgi:monovalent cation:H+ antiporter-2, CPA2 family